MKVAFVTDGTARLEHNILEREDVFCFNLKINFSDGSSISDTADPNIMTTFYQKMEADPVLPKTSQPEPSVFYHLFDQIIEQGYDTVLFFVISDQLSGTAQGIRMVAKEYENVPLAIHIFSNKALANTISYLTRSAIEMVEQGMPLDIMIDRIHWLDENMQTFGAVGSLDNFVKGGRASKMAGLLGNILNIIPIFKVESDGSIGLVEKVRTQKRAINRIIDLYQSYEADFPKGYEILISSASASEEAQQIQQRIHTLTPEVKISLEELSAVIAVHVGQGCQIITLVPNFDNYDQHNSLS